MSYCHQVQFPILQLRSWIQREEPAHSNFTKAGGRPRTFQVLFYLDLAVGTLEWHWHWQCEWPPDIPIHYLDFLWHLLSLQVGPAEKVSILWATGRRLPEDQSSFLSWLTMWQRTSYFLATSLSFPIIKVEAKILFFLSPGLVEVTPAILRKPSSEHHGVWYQWERAREPGVWELTLGNGVCFC